MSAVAPTRPAPCRVSVVIKAFNEEDNICEAIESCLDAVAEVGGEVVLADSHSTDRTVELASKYPIRIVQLANADERCCGVGPQLGYQHSLGEYIYIIDGDMKMVRGFLGQALMFLAQHPEVAGVSGRLVELNNDSLEYRERGLRASAHLQPGEVDRLDGGGLYRRLAIEESGYFSDRNLHSYEEFDLGVRLRSLGWKLWRLPARAVTHYGHDAPPYRLLLRRWRTRYMYGPGELLRAAAGQPHMRLVMRGARELRIYFAVLAWWALLAGALLWPVAASLRISAFAALARRAIRGHAVAQALARPGRLLGGFLVLQRRRPGARAAGAAAAGARPHPQPRHPGAPGAGAPPAALRMKQIDHLHRHTSHHPHAGNS